jgi:hypothetical protein
MKTSNISNLQAHRNERTENYLPTPKGNSIKMIAPSSDQLGETGTNAVPISVTPIAFPFDLSHSLMQVIPEAAPQNSQSLSINPEQESSHESALID